MESKADEAFRVCTKKDCCAKRHFETEQQFIKRFKESKLPIPLLPVETPASPGKRRRIHNPVYNTKIFDLGRVTPVINAGDAWFTEFPLSQELTRYQNPPYSETLTADGQRLVKNAIDRANAAKRIRTPKIAGCPFR